MSEENVKKTAEQRELILMKIKESGLINQDAPLSSVFDAASKLSGELEGVTVAYDSDKYFAVMK